VLSVLLSYLKAFSLDKGLLNLRAFRHYSQTHQMNIDANTLANLDILVSSASSSIVFSSSSSSAAASFGGRATGGSRKRERERGSLLWLFSHTRTAFGARLLRQWIRAPLQDADAINQRLDTVTEIVQGVGAWIGPLADALKSGVPDLSRALSRIQYGRTSPSEFLACLEAMQRCVDVLPRAAPSAAGAGVGTARKDDSANAFAVSSDLLQSMLQDLDLPVLRERLRYFIDSLNAEAVKVDDKAGLYVDSTLFPSLRQLKLEMEHVGNSLDKELVLIRKQLGAGYSALQYKSVLTTHYLIEVPNTVVKRIPQDEWHEVCHAISHSRHHGIAGEKGIAEGTVDFGSSAVVGLVSGSIQRALCYVSSAGPSSCHPGLPLRSGGCRATSRLRATRDTRSSRATHLRGERFARCSAQ